MGRLKDTMLMKTNAHFINNPGWGISFMIDNHKFHAKEGSDLCDLVRSMIIESIDAIKKAIDIRGYDENVVYTRTNEPHIKRQQGTAIFNQENLFEAVQKQIKTPSSVKLTKRLAGETRMAEMKKESVAKEPVKKEKVSVKATIVNIAEELEKLNCPVKKEKVEVIKEVVRTPSVTKDFLDRIDSEIVKAEEKEAIKVSPEQLVILKQYADMLSKLKVEKLTRDEVRKYKIRTESSLFGNSHSKFIKIYEEWKNTVKSEPVKEVKKEVKVKEVVKPVVKPVKSKVHNINFSKEVEAVFKDYESKLLKMHVDKIKRDDARKMGIKYRVVSKDNYGMFLEMYRNWKLKK